MLIQPDTYIRLIKNCPIDNTYEHTIYFESREEQEGYFKNLDGIPFTKQSYQRYSAGVLTVNGSMANLYNCNYMMFKNTAFENKWFYAFIKRVEYVNNSACRVYYDIDVMQTWLFDYRLGDCFVEREHSVTDYIAENLIHEDIYFGQYVYGETVEPVDSEGNTMEDLSVVIMFVESVLNLVTNMEAAKPFLHKQGYYGGAYQGIDFLAIPVCKENMKLLDDLINAIDFNTFGGFVSAFIMPTMFLPPNESTYEDTNKTIYFNLNRNIDFDGYVPQNNKLFTYPYTCANLTANRGDGNDFAFEYFTNDGGANFKATGNLCAQPSTMAYPRNYKGYDNYVEGGVSIANYPMCTWGNDSYSEWVNNHLIKSLLTVGAGFAIAGVSPAASIMSTAGLGASPIPGQLALPGSAPIAMLNPGTNPMLPVNEFKNIVNGFSNGLNSALSTPAGALMAIGMARSEAETGTMHGNADGDLLIGTNNGRKIVARVKHITSWYAKIVDDYFTRFGYATMSIKRPNISSRPHWNYVKTNGCVIFTGLDEETGVYYSGLPINDISKIKSIYDNGITFWKKDSKIGDYSKPNKPIPE